ncbi:MAG: DUF5995 family protein [Solirubrobacterales bacterium]
MARGWLALLAVLTVGATAPAGAGAQAIPPPNLPWTELLPALPSPPQTHPNRVAHCRKARLKCVRFQIRRMRKAQERFGCDHRGVFMTTYLELTRELRDTVRADPEFFDGPKFFFREDALFANVYFRTLRRWEQGREVPEAWRIALEVARDGEVNAAQDMLLGINAHVQNDMPFVLAKLGLRTRSGESRKPDHDKANAVLNSGYERVVSAINERFDPLVSLLNADWHPIDNVAGLEIVRLWREQVWRNAEKLVNAKTADERQRIADEIEANAAYWARGIALVPQPGYRAERDAYCARQLAG